MLGFYENFPQNIHRKDTFTSFLSKRKLQEKIIHILQDVNGKNLSFLEVASPSLPDCTVIFEWGIADAGGFTLIGEEEAKKMLNAIAQEQIRVIDLYCGIRYYKNSAAKKTPLKFDYYMMRVGFGESHHVEIQIFHERGPRYISPEELVNFLVARVNGASPKKTLKQAESV